ncbi:RBPJ-interacting and tubulin-associated protein 1 [Pterocles gutturalis]
MAAAAEPRAGRKGRGLSNPRPGGAAMRAAPGGGCAPPVSRRGRGCRRARASFVDESLFGSPAGARPAPPGFAPPWAAAPAAAPGTGGGSHPSSKCRLRGHAPSFCDETLFGAKPWAAPRLRKEDVAKLHSLLWSPPPAPRDQPGVSPRSRDSAVSPRSRDTPLRAVHPAPAAPAAAGSGLFGMRVAAQVMAISLTFCSFFCRVQPSSSVQEQQTASPLAGTLTE